ncbi:hemagglutinin repeat-containing protein [Burkholderia pyrrocinia]|uniref:hemagglutinin repeat-containing protein n=1 Tax=Burkholderia pyrrocinia TaxID=60550 RepID=UPI0030CFC43A
MLMSWQTFSGDDFRESSLPFAPENFEKNTTQKRMRVKTTRRTSVARHVLRKIVRVENWMNSRSTVSTLAEHRRPLWVRITAFVTAVVFAAVSIPVIAQISPATDGKGPGVSTTPSGVPLVQINRPSAAGVSDNHYSQFSTGSAGAVLNNSPTSTQTQIAGWVPGNANLTSGAKIILNQVTGTSPSMLGGPLEVAGARAQVVIANGNGITCSGCGFINTNKAVLTTGTPVIDSAGNLSSFRVTGGTVSFTGSGMNASNVERVDVLARAVQLNAALYANQLNVVTGANQIDANTLAATPIAGTSVAPSFGLDVSQLGGMYAQRILLVGTEAGVGVNDGGTIAAQTGDLSLSTQGQLTVSGNINAAGNLNIAARSGVSNSGAIYGLQSTTVNSVGDIGNSGTIAGQNQVFVNGQNVSSTGTLAAGVNANGQVGTSGDLTVVAGNRLTATGQNLAGGNATLQAATVDLSGSKTAANGSLAISATTGDVNLTGATTQAGQQANIAAPGGTVRNDALSATQIAQITAQQISINAAALSNRGGSIQQTGTNNTAIQIAGVLDNTGGTITTNAADLAIHAGSIANASGQIHLAGNGQLSVATGALGNQAGSIGSNGVLGINAASIDNTGGVLTSMGTASVASTGALTNVNGAIESAKGLAVTAGSANNTGGRIQSDDASGLTLQVAGQLTNAHALGTTSGGLIGANGNTQVSAGAITNSGTISSAQQLDVTATLAVDNSAGVLAADGIAIRAGSIKNNGGTISQTGTAAGATIAATGAVDNTSGVIAANGPNATISSGALTNDQGAISHAGSGKLDIQTGAFSNQQGTIATNGDATLATGAATNSGTIEAQKTLQLTSSSLTNSGAVESVGALSVNAGAQLANAGGKILAGTSTAPTTLSVTATEIDNSQGALGAGTVSLNATNLTNHGGSIVQSNPNGSAALNVANTLDNSNGGSIQVAATNLSLTPQILNNSGGTIAHAGNGVLTVQSGTVTNDGGFLGSNGATTINASTVSNRGGTLSAVGSTFVTGTNGVDNSVLSGKSGYIGGASVAVGSQGAVNNAGSLIEAATGSASVSGQTVTNDAGVIRALGAAPVTVTAVGALSNRGGSIGGNRNVSVSGASIDNTSGTLAALGDLNATSASTLSNASGLVEAQGNINANAAGAISNQSGKIKAVGANSALTLSGSSIDNSNGAITNAGTGATALTAASTITNANPTGTASSGLIAGNGAVMLNAASLSNTQGGNVSAAGDLTLNTPSSVVNDGGTLAAGGNLTVNQPGATFSNVGGSVSGGNVALTTATLDNTRGAIANPAGGAGNVGIHTGTLTNTNGSIGSTQDLSVTANSLVGDGKIVGGRDATINLQGNYTYDAANQITANRNLTFSTTGTFTNSGTFSSAGNLTLNAANVVNQAGADIASGNAADPSTGATTINAAGGDINNAGRIEGNTVTTTSNTLENSGSMIGGTVTANANTLTNDGAAAIIAGTNGVNLWVPGTVNNQNGATIYSLGDVNIAANGATDANGNLVNQTGTVNNLSSTIEVNGNLNVAANQINNVRQNIQTTTTTSTQTAKLLPLPWLHTGWAGASAPFQDVNTLVQSAYYLNPADIVSITPMVSPDGVLIQKVVVNMPANASAFQSAWGSYARPQSNGGTAWTDGQQQRLSTTSGQQVLYVQTVQNGQSNPDQAGGTAWPDHSLDTVANVYGSISYSGQYGDCTTNCVRLEVQSQYTNPNAQFLKGGSPNLSSSNLVEAERDATTTTTATTLAPGSGAPALMTSGGAMNLTIGTQLNNNNGTIAAGGNLSVDGQASNGSNAKIANTSTQLATTYSFSNRSGYGSVGGPQVPSTWVTWTNPTITLNTGVAGGTITSNQAVTINGGQISNTSVSATGGVTGASAQSLGLGSVSLTGSAGNGAVSGGTSVTTTSSVTGKTTATTVSGAVRNVDGARSSVLNPVLPSSGLYKVANSPGVNYFVQTDPRFTSYSNFISSDYMLNLLGINPMQTQKRLGDGFYETQLVQQQITSLTGRRYLPGYASDEDEYQKLMASGVATAKQFNLEPGVALTDAQMAALTHDIVWLVSETVTLPDGSTQTALVPQVYLAKTDDASLSPTGALIAGDSVSIHGTDVTNAAGTIAATKNALVVADNDIQNLGGLISGGNVGLQAGNDIVNQSLTNTETASFANGTSSHTSIGAVGQIQATNNAVLMAGNSIRVEGAQVAAGGNLGLSAGNGIDVGTVQTGSSVGARLDAQNTSTYTTTNRVGSSLNAGGNLSAVSGGDIGVTGSNLTSGGNMTVAGAGNVDITSATNSTTDTRHGANSKGWNSFNLANQTSVGSNLSAGGSATVLAGAQGGADGLTVATDGTAPAKNLTLQGSSVVAGNNGKGTGALTLGATGDVNIGASQDTTTFNSASHSTSNHIVSSTSTDTARSFTGSNAVGSLVSGDRVNVTAGHDLTVKGSDVAGTNDVTLHAGHDVTIGTAQNTSQESDYFAQHKSGLMSGGGLSVSVGNSSAKTTSESSQVTNVGSTVGSVKGNLNITAGNNLHVTGSDLVAGQNVTGTAANVTIDSATDTAHQSQTQQTSQSGLTIGLSGSVGDALNNAVSQAQGVRNSSNSGNSRAAALHGIAAAGDAATVAGGAATAAMGGTPNIGVQVSIGSSHSESASSEDQAMQKGSSVTAGGAATFVATGDGTPGSGNVTIAGSNVSANDVALMAKNQVNLLNTTSTDSTRSSNSSSSASVGVSVGLTSGVGISAAMQNAHGSGNSDAAIQNNTHIDAKNSATIISGGDTNIVGANVNADKVVASVGGNLNVASVQDTTTSTAHQSSTGGGITISQGGVGGSFSAQHGSANGNYAGVNEQSGIQAGSGGFNVNVAGNTDLKGAYIASTADASKNSLTTATLTTSDIQNHSQYNADSSGFSAGASVGVTQKSVGPASVSGAGGVTPMISQSDSGNESATTRSGISLGSIAITKPTEQTQDVAGINRDTSNLNGKVANIPDLQNMLSQQSDTMSAAQAAGQTVSQAIGTYADVKRDQALTQFDADVKAGNLDAAKADLNEAQSWLEGGSNRVALQIGGGALIGGLGGSSALTGALGGAAGAGLSAALANQTKSISDTVGGATGSQLIGNIAGNVASGLGGALVGGSAGAAMSSNVNLYNQNNDDGDKNAQARIGLGRKVLNILSNVASQVGAGGGSLEGEIPKVSAGSLASGLAGAAETGDTAASSRSAFTDKYLSGSGGRWGNAATRALNYNISQDLAQAGYRVTGGGGVASEEYIPGNGPGTLGGTYVDITAESTNGQIIRVQTVTTQSDGVTPTASEQAAAQRIKFTYPNDVLVLIPKGASSGQINQAIQNAIHK